MKTRLVKTMQTLAAWLFVFGIALMFSRNLSVGCLLGVIFVFSAFTIAVVAEIVKAPPKMNFTFRKVPALCFTLFALPCFIVGAITLSLTIISVLRSAIGTGDPWPIVGRRAIISVGMLAVAGVITFVCLKTEKTLWPTDGMFEHSAGQPTSDSAPSAESDAGQR